MDNMELWNKLKMPPKDALKQIKGGRLSGMTDISPQWRYMALTEIFGPCGVGWKYEITRLWIEDGDSGTKCAFAQINLYTFKDKWSEPIPGIGGSMLVAKEKSGPYTSDEAYKMAVTDALSVAAKMIGVGADIYLNNLDGSKYRKTEDQQDNRSDKAKEAFETAEYYNCLALEMDKCTNKVALAKWFADNAAKVEKLNATDKKRLRGLYAQYIAIFKKDEENAN